MRVVASGEGHAVAVLVCHEEDVDVGCVERELEGDGSVLLPQSERASKRLKHFVLVREVRKAGYFPRHHFL